MIALAACAAGLVLVALGKLAERRWNQPPAERMARNLLRRYRYMPRRRPTVGRDLLRRNAQPLTRKPTQVIE